jgi:hypothetical protein
MNQSQNNDYIIRNIEQLILEKTQGELESSQSDALFNEILSNNDE